MTNVKLITPCKEYLQSYLDACREFKSGGNKFFSVHDPDTFDDWKDSIFSKFESNRLGTNIPEGYVPMSTFWLVQNGAFIGVGNIRHSLTPSLEQFGGHIGYAIRPTKQEQGYGTLQLELLLKEAFKLGIDQALVTCDEVNVGSYRVMEKNGGVYQDTIESVIDGQPRRTKRYWIDTAPKQTNRYTRSSHLYDLDQRDILTADIPFYLDYASEQNGDVLELACGTGRVSLELAKAGYNITGLDLSEQMLEIFRQKLDIAAPEVRQCVTLTHGNMASFQLDRKFSLIIAPFRAFQALTVDEDIKGCLRCVKEHLRDGGLFIINTFRPYKQLDTSWCYPETVQWEHDDKETDCHVTKKHWGDRIDTVRQIIYPHFAYEITYPSGQTERITEDLSLKYWYYEQLKSLLLENSYDVIEEYGWYDKSPIENGRELIFVASPI